MENKSKKDPDCGKIRFKTLIIHGDKYRTLYTDKFKNRRKWQKPDEKIIISVLPGTVLKVFSNEGDNVSKGDTMLIIEAMKMRNTYYYPHTGKIKHVHVKSGDKIPKGFVMIEYE
jgi:biotin carboxyl carrier protein